MPTAHPYPSAIAALAGPTACGKSDLALTIADAMNGEIVSVDSGAIYRDMNIGTATPEATMQQRVRHHLINHIDPTEHYSVGRFYADLKATITDIHQRGKNVLLVGGTMMYFNTLHQGLSAMPTVTKTVWDSVTTDLQERGLSAMHAALYRVDAITAKRIKTTDQQRLHRAWCIYRATGIPLSVWQQNTSRQSLPLNLVRLIPSNRADLRQRISNRLEQMWDDGLEQETERLLSHWQLAEDARPLRLVGYQQALQRLSGRIDTTTMRQRAYHATCQLAKRQLTWLRRWSTYPAIDPLIEKEKVQHYFQPR